jgi:subtilase family serine protease
LKPLQARCLAIVRPSAVQPSRASLVRDGKPNVSQPRVLPQGYGPASLQSAYKLPVSGGSGRTIAIVDAFDDPSAEADLNFYRATYGLPACTVANGCFAKVNEGGASAGYPPPDPSWALEISLDLDMVSAACPKCRILLVEAASANVGDLGTGDDAAVRLGAMAVSNSYGAAEFGGIQQFAAFYDHPGTTITASSGDAGFGTAQFPAAFPTVMAVGGTSLHGSHNHRGWSEQAWSGAGSGCSAWIAKPAWQHDNHCFMRTVADVSAVADPKTGVAVFDSLPFLGTSGWWVVGGTSVSSPLIAGVAGLAGNGGVASSYPYSHASALYDVSSGSNGFCGSDYLCTGKPGYDGPTGLGTPHGTGAF